MIFIENKHLVLAEFGFCTKTRTSPNLVSRSTDLRAVSIRQPFLLHTKTAPQKRYRLCYPNQNVSNQVLAALASFFLNKSF